MVAGLLMYPVLRSVTGGEENQYLDIMAVILLGHKTFYFIIAD